MLCREGLPHIRPCGVTEDPEECACGCDALEGWCYHYEVNYLRREIALMDQRLDAAEAEMSRRERELANLLNWAEHYQFSADICGDRPVLKITVGDLKTFLKARRLLA